MFEGVGPRWHVTLDSAEPKVRHGRCHAKQQGTHASQRQELH